VSTIVFVCFKFTGKTGEHGDEECLPCIPIPHGHFSDSRIGDSRIQPCVVNCTYLNRDTQRLCSNTGDAQCGVCLPG